MLPRIRARSIQIDNGKWAFEISLWNLEGTEMIGGDPVGVYGPFETEDECKKEMRNAVKIACEAYKGPNGEKPTGYVDLKNGGEYRKFEEH